LPRPYSAAGQAAGYRDDISVLQAEFSLTQVLDRPLSGRVFFDQVIHDNLGIGRPGQVGLIFGRRIVGKGPRATPGRFRTREFAELPWTVRRPSIQIEVAISVTVGPRPGVKRSQPALSPGRTRRPRSASWSNRASHHPWLPGYGRGSCAGGWPSRGASCQGGGGIYARPVGGSRDRAVADQGHRGLDRARRLLILEGVIMTAGTRTESDFGFAGLATPEAEAPVAGGPDPLGALAGLLGTWKGHGFNAIWRPHHPASPQDRFLELNKTDETLVFTRIHGPIPNR